MRKRIIISLLCAALTTTLTAEEHNKAAVFFCRVGQMIDNILLNGLDTNYVSLPDYSWRVAVTTGEVGLHSTYLAKSTPYLGDVKLSSLSTPSLDLGFNVGYRAIGFGYSWDLMHPNSRNINFSAGSKMFGLEFLRLRSTNFQTTAEIPSVSKEPMELDDSKVWITHTNVSFWYALNWAHYSHNAAMKQAFLQTKTAGSLLLSASYTATDISFNDEAQMLPSLLFGVNQLTTHQASLGLGYGINYTPNHGKVLLHLSATAKLVCYSINQIYYTTKDTAINGYARPCYNIYPEHPVHVSGSMRAAVAWEINKYVHMSLWGQADNVRFEAGKDEATAQFSNWNWHAYLNVAFRFGVGKKRVRQIVQEADAYIAPSVDSPEKHTTKLPRWVTDYFFSSRM